MVLLVLALLWAVVLIPPLVRNRSASRAESKRIRGMRKFRRRLAALAPPYPGSSGLPARRPREASRPAGSARPHVAVIAHPRPPAMVTEVTETPQAPVAPAALAAAPDRSMILNRRRQRLGLLLGAMAASLVLGAVPLLRPLWAVHLMLDAAGAGYAVWLRRAHRRHLAVAAKVHYLPTATGAPTAVHARADTAEVIVAAAVRPLRRSAAAASSS